jgi:hypothetical protein
MTKGQTEAIVWTIGLLWLTPPLLAWITAVYSLIKMAGASKPAAPPLANPLNRVFYPDDLTEVGQRHRTRLIKAVRFFFLWWLGSVVVFWLTNRLSR